MSFVAVVLMGSAQLRSASFKELDVQRINLVEPDGTLRLVLSSEALFPGLYFHGKEYAHPNRSTAGLLFLNDEGTESGGLIYGGKTDENGHVSAYGHLSFDQFNQDQVLTLDASESSGLRKAGVSVWDRPDYSTEELAKLDELTKSLTKSERDAKFSEFFDNHKSAHPRLYMGKSENGSVSLRLNDGQGKERLIIEVSAEGRAIIRVLDKDGNETARFPES